MPSMYGDGGNFASVHRRMSSSASSFVHLNDSGQEAGSISSHRDQFRKPIPFQSPKVPEVARSPESLGFDKPSFVYDHSEDPVQKDTILLNYCIDDIETLCRELRASRADIVHHLFPPLAFLMDACLDLFDEDVQREVASPFLTQTAITLLQHCLSS